MTELASLAARVRADLAWATGLIKFAELRGRGRSAMIGFDRVRPSSRGMFQPRRHAEIAPATLDRLIRALKRWRIDIVSIDEALMRLAEDAPHRFVSLSFNGSYRDVVTSARPILLRHKVPYTVYVPSAYPDGIAEPWWPGLEAVIARHARISLVIDNREIVFAADGASAKQQLYDRLDGWMRGLSPDDSRRAIRDLCRRYDVDRQALLRDIAMGWDDIASLAADPRVTIGSASVNYPVLANLADDAARRDIAMGRAVLETALQRPVRHFAFPFGDPGSFDARHVEMVRGARFASAVTAVPDVLDPKDAELHRLPRLMWRNGMTLRGLRARLAGY